MSARRKVTIGYGYVSMYEVSTRGRRRPNARSWVVSSGGAPAYFDKPDEAAIYFDEQVRERATRLAVAILERDHDVQP